MATLIQKVIQSDGNEKEIIVAAPEGWTVPDTGTAIGKEHVHEPTTYVNTIAHNLPLVAKRTELLIQELNDRFMIPVSISYIRIDESNAFHVLLLVDKYDYLSPKIHAARLLAGQFTYVDDTFDVRFMFSVKSQNMMVDSLIAQGYKLMHITEQEKDAA